MGDEMEEGVAQQTARGETEQHLEEGGVVLGILEGDEEQDEKGSCTDEGSGGKGVGPELPRALEGRGELCDEETPRCCRVVPMGPHQQWKQKEEEGEGDCRGNPQPAKNGPQTKVTFTASSTSQCTIQLATNLDSSPDAILSAPET